MQHDLSLKPDEQGNVRLTLHFKDEAERTRFNEVCPSVELTEMSLQNGYENAVARLVPCLMAGGYGADEATIDRNVAKVLAAAKWPPVDEATREHEQALDLCHSVGMRSALMATKERFLLQVAAVAKGFEAMNLTTLALQATADAIGMAATCSQAAPVAAPTHALALGARSRPLRPEDFGALPVGKR